MNPLFNGERFVFDTDPLAWVRHHLPGATAEHFENKTIHTLDSTEVEISDTSFIITDGDSTRAVQVGGETTVCVSLNGEHYDTSPQQVAVVFESKHPDLYEYTTHTMYANGTSVYDHCTGKLMLRTVMTAAGCEQSISLNHGPWSVSRLSIWCDGHRMAQRTSTEDPWQWSVDDPSHVVKFLSLVFPEMPTDNEGVPHAQL